MRVQSELAMLFFAQWIVREHGDIALGIFVSFLILPRLTGRERCKM